MMVITSGFYIQIHREIKDFSPYTPTVEAWVWGKKCHAKHFWEFLSQAPKVWTVTYVQKDLAWDWQGER